MSQLYPLRPCAFPVQRRWRIGYALPMSFHLPSYFTRIGYRGPTAPTRETLDALTEAHTKAIPFENLDVILGRGIQLTEEAIFDKLVTRKRGGYCFEQNALLLMALQHLGFEVKPISGRVRVRFATREPDAPRTHVFLRVEIAGQSYLTDVGIGAASLTKALRLVLDEEQATPHDTRRIEKVGNRYYHQVRYSDTWIDASEFTLEEMPLIDREVANWYTSTHPQSHFRSSVIAARALDGGRRISLQNLELVLRERGKDPVKRQLTSAAEFHRTLTGEFGLGLDQTDTQKLYVASLPITS